DIVVTALQSAASRTAALPQTVPARLPFRVNSERGRTEYLLVNLVADCELRDAEGKTPQSAIGSLQSAVPTYVAYPMGKGSGSVTTFSRADGFVIIERQREYLEADETVAVHLLGSGLQPADLIG